jgi:hypothetical protein
MHAQDSQPWLFPDPPETKVGVSKGILNDGDVIHCVEHQERDVKWWFWGSPLPPQLGRFRPAEVTLGEIVALHPYVKQFFDLPFGWAAERFPVESSWQRRRLKSTHQ